MSNIGKLAMLINPMGLFDLMLFSGAVQLYTIYVLKPIGFISLAKPTYEIYYKGYKGIYNSII